MAESRSARARPDMMSSASDGGIVAQHVAVEVTDLDDDAAAGRVLGEVQLAVVARPSRARSAAAAATSARTSGGEAGTTSAVAGSRAGRRPRRDGAGAAGAGPPAPAPWRGRRGSSCPICTLMAGVIDRPDRT